MCFQCMCRVKTTFLRQNETFQDSVSKSTQGQMLPTHSRPNTLPPQPSRGSSLGGDWGATRGDCIPQAGTLAPSAPTEMTARQTVVVGEAVPVQVTAPATPRETWLVWLQGREPVHGGCLPACLLNKHQNFFFGKMQINLFKMGNAAISKKLTAQARKKLVHSPSEPYGALAHPAAARQPATCSPGLHSHLN